MKCAWRRSLPAWCKRLLVALVLTAVASAWPLAHAGTALVVWRDVAPPDAILMLASKEWERLPAAAALARRYPEALVLLTVPRTVTEHNCYRCGERVSWLQAEGVDAARIRLVEGLGGNTYGEAMATLAYASRQPFSRLLIVTSPYHTRRAWATFTQVFAGTAVKLGIAPAAGARGRPDRWWLSPYDRHYVLYEWAATLKYRLLYQVPV